MGIFKWKKKEIQAPITEETHQKEVIEESSTEKTEEITHKRKQQYHVSHHKDGWKVKLTNGEKAIKVFHTQLEAIEYAKHLAETHNTSYQIHKKDGSIRKKKY